MAKISRTFLPLYSATQDLLMFLLTSASEVKFFLSRRENALSIAGFRGHAIQNKSK